MKKFLLTVLCAVLVFSCVSCSFKYTYHPKTVSEKYYYSMGYYAASNYSTYYDDLDYKAFSEGIRAFGNGTFNLSEEEVEAIIFDYYCKDADAFLEENKKNSGVKVTDSGLQYKEITKGNGALPTDEDVVNLDYELRLIDGTVADSTYSNGESVDLPVSGVIPGFAEALRMMPEGSKYELWINPRLGYGEYDLGIIPAFSVLNYTVEVHHIVK